MDYEDFSYEDSTHVYRQNGVVVPSATQVLKACGVIDYSQVPRIQLEKARFRGSLVHQITAERDRSGEMPYDWATEDCRPRLEAYEQFLHDYRGRIQWIAIEKPIVTTVDGMAAAGTPDRILLIDADEFVIDEKCSATYQEGWDLQLMIYARLREAGTGRLPKRMVLQLFATGKYKSTICSNLDDRAAAHAALALAHWKMGRGLWNPSISA